MKKQNEPLQESLPLTSETQTEIRLNQNGTESGCNGVRTLHKMDVRFSAHRWLLKHLQIICDVELDKPYIFLKGRNFVRSNNDIEGRGESKKRMTIGNKLYRGSKFALIRKDADLLYGVSLHERRHNL